MAYELGQRVRLQATFTNEVGVVADPDAVTLRLQAPDGAISAPVPSKVSTGVYRHELVPDQAGWYRVRFVGAGSVDAVAQGAFEVQESLL